ncbi:hypothetical protein ENUP19_0124G0012 [Entamoeba nuttalli]|uniref:Rho-associated protein kinase n=1 Tax=Entamoeba nuttalli TaxID=412467 RepID=A0ABQ0DJ82_9EUKA
MEINYKELYFKKTEECKLNHCSKESVHKKEKELKERIVLIEKKLDEAIEMMTKKDKLTNEETKEFSEHINTMKFELISKQEKEKYETQIFQLKNQFLIEKKQMMEKQQQLIQQLYQYQCKCTELIKTRKQNQNQLEELQSQITQIKMNKQETSESEEMGEKWRISEKKLKLLQNENDQLRVKNLELLSREFDYQTIINKLKTKKDVPQTERINENDIIVDHLRNEIKEIKENYQQLEGTFNKKTKQVKKLKSEKAVLQESIDVLESENRQLKDQNVQLQSSLKKIQEENEKNEKIKRRLKEKISILTETP